MSDSAKNDFLFHKILFKTRAEGLLIYCVQAVYYLELK